MSTDVEPELPTIEIEASGPNPAEQWVNGEKVQTSPGYPPLLMLLADAFGNWVQSVVLDSNADAVHVRFQIDGLWRDMQAMDRQTGDYVNAVLKQISGMDFRNRESAQKGSFKAKWYFKKFECEVRSEPVPTGERTLIKIALPRPEPETLVEMGMRQKSFETFKGFFSRGSGLIIAATQPGDGASTLWKGVKAAGDRFMSDYVTLEPAGEQEPEVINVNSVTYDKNQTFHDALNKLFLREPDAVFIPNLRDPETLKTTIELNEKYQRLVAVQIEANSAADAIYRMLVLGMKPDVLSRQLFGVISSRLVRKLCDNCKQPYEPDPATLSRLGIPQGRVRQFFAPFDPYQFAEVDKNGNQILPPPCENCQGVGYFGRLGLFEMFEMDDDLRRLVSGMRPLPEMVELLRRKQVRSYREEGIAAIALGQTSIEEIQRVLQK